MSDFTAMTRQTRIQPRDQGQHQVINPAAAPPSHVMNGTSSLWSSSLKRITQSNREKNTREIPIEGLPTICLPSTHSNRQGKSGEVPHPGGV